MFVNNIDNIETIDDKEPIEENKIDNNINLETQYNNIDYIQKDNKKNNIEICNNTAIWTYDTGCSEHITI
jgi:hypothetical protein